MSQEQGCTVAFDFQMIARTIIFYYTLKSPNNPELRLEGLDPFSFEKRGNEISSYQENTIIPVVGITITDRIEFVAKLRERDQITFRRDPENQYDQNAIKALDQEGHLIGYVAKDISEIYAPLIDQGAIIQGWLHKKEPRVLKIAISQR